MAQGHSQEDVESPEVQVEQEWHQSGMKKALSNYNERIVEEKEAIIKRAIIDNYSRIRGVEKELSQLQVQLKITAGPTKSALEIIRKKIEIQNESVVTQRQKVAAMKKALAAAEESLVQEERQKEQLCGELNLLVQQSAHAQLDRLEQLTQKLEHLSTGFSSDDRQGCASSPATPQPQLGRSSSGQAEVLTAAVRENSLGKSASVGVLRKGDGQREGSPAGKVALQGGAAAGAAKPQAKAVGKGQQISEQQRQAALDARARHVSLGAAKSKRLEGSVRPQAAVQAVSKAGPFEGFD